VAPSPSERASSGHGGAGRHDVGRLVTLPLVVLLLFINAVRVGNAATGAVGPVEALGALLIVVFAFPVLPHPTHGAAVAAAADVLLLAGSIWSVWSLRRLGRSFSVIAQARAVVSTGPYRLVRHPLYLGEVVSAAGLALTVAGWPALAAWCVLVSLQVYRSVQEERVLSAHLPDYADYRARTHRLIPGVL
jgi:protein-S-isoprenylcysteine O-methyltransferase Ste14